MSAKSEFKAALTCFLKVHELEQGTRAYRDSCAAIGMMYELGRGVEKDMQAAIAWYKKGGL